MRQPLFSEGEKVILKSIKFPQFNGVYHISKIVWKGCNNICSITGTTYHTHEIEEPFVYALCELGEVNDRGFEYVWRESSLRKWHDPSSDSFDEMMEKLKKAKTEDFI